MVGHNVRENLERLVVENGDDYAGLSKLIGRNAAYIQQFIKRGTPKILPERERGILARYFGVDEVELGAPETRSAMRDVRFIPRLAVEASAGPGSVDAGDSLAGKVGFDPKWLKKLSSSPERLSLISVAGDSMAPTLVDGEDIMVDASAAEEPLRDGIYVIRMDGVLMVKRLARAPGGKLSVRSDNPDWPSWEDVEPSDIQLIGRVVWAGRRV